MSPAERAVPAGGPAAEEVTEGWSGGTGEPIVLLHGVNASWRIWRPVLPLLEPHGAVHALTLAGHRGGPALAPGPVTIVEVADAMERQLDALGLPTAHLVGNSLGGWLALELAQRGRARSVTAFSPAGAWRRPRDRARLLRGFRLLASLIRRPWFQRLLARPGFRTAALRTACARPELIPADEVPGMIADMLGCTLISGLLESVATAESAAPFAIPGSCPVRIVWPVRDRTIPWAAYGAPMVASVPGCEVVRAVGVGHVPMGDDPDLVVRQILEVVRRAATAAPARTGGSAA